MGYIPGMAGLGKPLAIAGALNIPVWTAIAFGVITEPPPNMTAAHIAIMAAVPLVASFCALILMDDGNG